METSRVTHIPEEVWSKLSVEAVLQEGIIARQALPDVDSRVLAALDRESRRHIVIRLAQDDSSLEDSQSRGVSISTQSFIAASTHTDRFLDLLCIDGSGHAALNLIGGEIAERLASGLETPAQCVSRVVSKWRRFWSSAPKTLLSREEQVGLFAELWFLLYWLLPRNGVGAVHSWRGPFASRHDFEGSLDSVEVKGTTSTRGPIHRINGLTQLESPEKGSLKLFSLQLREEAGSNNHLPGLVEQLRETLTEDSALLNHFENILASTGYSPLHEADYAAIKYRIVEELLFEVNDDFPAIRTRSFKEAMPVNVESLSYVLNLSSLRDSCLARRPTDQFSLNLDAGQG